MRSVWDDPRMMLFVLAAEGREASGAALLDLWRRASRSGRLHRLLRSLEQAGLVERTGEGAFDDRLFRATHAGRQAVLGAVDPEERWRRPWDGKWRLVLFDVPQARAAVRTRLRRKLRALHFGWLQNSVWLSPDPLDELARQFASERVHADSLALLEARPAGGESDADLVTAAWDFAPIARLHAAHMKILHARPAGDRRANASAWIAWAQTEQRAWQHLARVDPLLPEPLWPKGYAGRSVWHARLEALRAGGESLVRHAAHA